MRTLIVSQFVTLDGVMEAPGGEPSHPHTGWVADYQGPEQVEHKYREMVDAGTLLIGRVTYESFAGAWPTYEGEFADRMNSMDKVVVSNTLTDPQWHHTTVLGGDIVAGVTALKQGDGAPIVVQGSNRLVHTLLDADLVDELRIMVFPVTIGAGLRLFPDTLRKTTWDLVASREFPSKVREDVYRRV
jgi:dihydrofolate reductase